MFDRDLKAALDPFNILLTDRQYEQIYVFTTLLIETNKVMNLTAITEPKEIAVKHMADSLSCYDKTYFPKGAAVLDLGTGAGFPGIPLAILRPDLHVTFFDSLQKRLIFLKTVVSKIGISNAAFIHGRAEDEAHRAEYREQFDVVTSRAVARLNILTEWALPYVRIGGVFAALKGAQYEEELTEASSAISILGGTVAEIRPVHLIGIEDKRAVLYIKKDRTSPKKYPRKPKIAAKNPL